MTEALEELERDLEMMSSTEDYSRGLGLDDELLDSIEKLVEADVREGTVEGLIRAKERIVAMFDEAINERLADSSKA